MAVWRLVKLPSDAPPTAASSSGMPSASAAARARSQSARFRGVGSSGGRSKPAPDLDRGRLADRLQATDHSFDPGRLGRGRDRTSTTALAAGAITFGSQAAVDLAHVHRRSSLEIGQLEQALDLVRELEDGARAGARLESRVACDPGDLDREHTDPLARRLQAPGRPERRLEDESTSGRGGKALDVGTGLDAADLLVAVDQHDRGQARVQIVLAQRSEREQHLHQPALHVEHARPVEATLLGAQRHSLDRPQRPHRVQVAEQQLRGILAPARDPPIAPARLREQVIADLDSRRPAPPRIPASPISTARISNASRCAAGTRDGDSAAASRSNRVLISPVRSRSQARIADPESRIDS